MLFDDLGRGRAAISSGMLFYQVKLLFYEVDFLVGVRDCKRISNIFCHAYVYL